MCVNVDTSRVEEQPLDASDALLNTVFQTRQSCFYLLQTWSLRSTRWKLCILDNYVSFVARARF